MLRVVGGTYRELCREGDWDQLFGSGLRAAAALQRWGGAALSTYVGESDGRAAGVVASTFGVRLEARPIPATVRFRYAHGLSTPLIEPAPHTLPPADPILVEADAVLRFGMIEGEGVVRGGRVVYDPQSPHAPTGYRVNGSDAESLAFVCNAGEATRLTGQRDPGRAGTALLDGEKADVVVVKRGSLGAAVIDRSGTGHVPAYRTDRVWTIGSGDVFSAVFAQAWAADGVPPLEAASLASRAAATYCSSLALPVPPADELRRDDRLVPIDAGPESGGGGPPLIYLAGPFFNMMERWLVGEARDALLGQGFRVFSPFHDVGLGAADEVVPKDIAALDRCDGLFAIVDHLDPGTLFEVGYARAKGTPVVAFGQNVPPESMKMLQGTRCVVCDDFVTAIYRTAWAVGR